MKHTALPFSLLFLMLFSGAATAQSDTTRIQIGNAKVIIVEEDSTKGDWEDEEADLDSELTHWAGVDLGVNMLVNKTGSTDLGEENDWLDLQYERSLSWRFNIFEEKIKIVRNHVGLVTGLGLTYNSYGFRNEITVISNTDAFRDTTFGIADSVIEFSKTKLRATYLNIPLLLEFNTSEDPKRTFHIAAGAIGGWKIGSITKQHYESEGSNVRVRSKQDFNLTPFTLDLTARVGYRNFTLFANYGLTPLFRDGKGPEVYPVTFGLQIVPW
jgi:hypothetical protein